MTASPTLRFAAQDWRHSPFLFVGLGVALLVCWSSGFVGVRFANEEVPVATILFWRSLVSGMLLLPFALRGQRLSLRALGEQAMFAFLGMFLYLGGFALAIAYRVPTGLVALMADLVPLAIAALSFPILGQRLSGRQWLGSAIAMGGVLIVSADSLRLGHAPALAYALPILGMISFGVSTVLQKRVSVVPLPIVQRLCLQCLCAALMFAPVAATRGEIAPPQTAHFVLGIAWLVGLATFGGWGIYYLCLRLWSPVRVSAIIYLSPPVTLLWSWFLFDEPLTFAMFLGLAITLAGVALVSSGQNG
ncbi:DMT family transporter [Tabrizicola sp. J26]|uniref:DMT family transporter n=1 Tax=Alitabrizicola rongguiensis TaxID=2909234 RepID=UPI001F3F94F0|nr:DMT family transporter [Tabrizicola rongguiensis]MCF1707833.1 DMT family transporter [Tabrizicola rongguiensis]